MHALLMVTNQDQVSQLHPQQESDTGFSSAAALVDDRRMYLVHQQFHQQFNRMEEFLISLQTQVRSH